MDPAMKNIQIFLDDQFSYFQRSDKNVIYGGWNGRMPMISKMVPFDADFVHRLPPFIDLLRRPRLLQLRLERQKAYLKSLICKAFQIWDHLRLHKGLAQAEVTNVKGPGHLRCLCHG